MKMDVGWFFGVFWVGENAVFVGWWGFGLKYWIVRGFGCGFWD